MKIDKEKMPTKRILDLYSDQAILNDTTNFVYLYSHGALFCWTYFPIINPHGESEEEKNTKSAYLLSI